MRSTSVLALGFLGVIAVGAALLALPLSSSTFDSVGFLPALFTSVSATCVTGLVTLDVGNQLSLFGQLVVLTLIQIGGLGFMLFVTAAWVALGKRVTLRSRLVLKESMNMPGLSGGVKMTLRVLAIALSVEMAGAALLCARFIPMYGLWRGLYVSVFHAVSAFCNAGFDLFGDYASLTGFAGDGYVLAVIAALIVLGGLGFAALSDCIQKKGRFRALALHTKIVLTTSAILILIGFAAFLLTEGRGALFAFFQSVTVRTAGFDSAGRAALTDAGKFISACLMMIGASPASTGGGVKTSTVFLLLATAVSVARGREDANAFGKRLPRQLVRTALCILLASLVLLILATVALTITERGRGFAFIDLLYEVTSALATVGLSSAGTPGISVGGQIVLMLCMFIGRVGPMTVILSLARGNKPVRESIRYPEETIMIG